MATTVGFAEALKGSDDSTSLERCSRCGGLMVEEQCLDLLDDTGRIHFTALRCVQCGELVDPVILRHRQVGTEGNRIGGRARHQIGRSPRRSRNDAGQN